MATRAWPCYTQEYATPPFRDQSLSHAGQTPGHTTETRHLQRHMPGHWELRGDGQAVVYQVCAVGSSNTDVPEHSTISSTLPTRKQKLPSKQ